jgi:hypothetical protein
VTPSTCLRTAGLLGALAFCGSAVLAGLELRRAHLGALPLKGELDGGLSLEDSLSRGAARPGVLAARVAKARHPLC